MYILKMPKADENMSEGTVIRWLAAEGDDVSVDQDLVECVADKGEFMVYSEADGKLLKIFAAENSVVPIGYGLAAIGSSDEQMPDIETSNAELMAKMQQELTATKGLQADRGARVRATPAARRIAKELGVDLAEVAAKKGNALVKEDDVRAFAGDAGK